MADGSFYTWATSAAPPAWLALIFGVVWGFRTWDVWKARIMATKTGEDAISGNQIARLEAENERRDIRIQRLEVSEERCREELADAKNRIAELEGYNIGAGNARQDAQRMLSEGREQDRKGRDTKK